MCSDSETVGDYEDVFILAHRCTNPMWAPNRTNRHSGTVATSSAAGWP